MTSNSASSTRVPAAFVFAVAVLAALAGHACAGASTGADVQCRAALAKGAQGVAARVLVEQARCHHERLSGAVASGVDCNDPAALPAASLARVAAAQQGLADLAASRCAQAATPADNGYWICPTPCDGESVDDYAGVVGCLACIVDDRARRLSATVLGAPAAPEADGAVVSCQRRLGKALSRHAKKRIRTQQRCQKRQDRGKLEPTVDCRSDDSKGRLAKLAAKADASVDKCDAAALAALDTCAEDPAAVKACMREEVAQHADAVFRGSVHRIPDTTALAAAFESRTWLLYAPAGFNPNLGCPAGFPDEASIRADLRLARAAGFDALATSGFDCSLADVARIAREEGFAAVVPGLFMFNEAIRREEVANAVAEAEHVTGFGVGNEGLVGCGGSLYTVQTLLETMLELRDATGKPVASSEQVEDYLDGGCLDGVLLDKADWLFPIVHPYNNGIVDPAAGVAFTVDRDARLRALTTLPVLQKENGWPTAGGSGASEANQEAYFNALKATGVRFAYFEAVDQLWKPGPPWEPFWGLWRSDRTPKRFIADNAP